uniref:Uncharacterized protein n=1 Tax=Oryza glumipatula TaxID=40148 RepID=A0A0D9Y775_9ORYZ
MRGAVAEHMDGAAGGGQRRGRAPRQQRRGDISCGAAAAPFVGDDSEVPLSSSTSMVVGDESSSGRARWVPLVARTVGRVRRAVGGRRHRGHWTGTEAAVVLVPISASCFRGGSPPPSMSRSGGSFVVEELGVSSPLIGVAIWAPSDSSFGDVLLCFRRRPLSILCCALCFLSRSHDAGGDADEAEEDYEEELHACVDSPPPPASVSSFSSHRRKTRERERGGSMGEWDWGGIGVRKEMTCGPIYFFYVLFC